MDSLFGLRIIQVVYPHRRRFGQMTMAWFMQGLRMKQVQTLISRQTQWSTSWIWQSLFLPQNNHETIYWLVQCGSVPFLPADDRVQN